MKKYFILLLLLTSVLSFKILNEYPLKKVVSKFGEVFWHRNTSDY